MNKTCGSSKSRGRSCIVVSHDIVINTKEKKLSKIPNELSLYRITVQYNLNK